MLSDVSNMSNVSNGRQVGGRPRKGAEWADSQEGVRQDCVRQEDVRRVDGRQEGSGKWVVVKGAAAKWASDKKPS
jgi:hypothetical protein